MQPVTEKNPQSWQTFSYEARGEKALADGGLEKEGEGGKYRERLFVWLSTLCERGGR